MRLYHFTSTFHLPSILREGRLRTTESNGSFVTDHAKPDVVWLLDTPDLEYDHGLGGSVVDKTAVRIAIDIPSYRVERWTDWADRHGVDADTREIMVATGGGPEAASHWWVSEQPIARRWWSGVAVRQPEEADAPASER